jgi:diamine N-acetyltransferase
MTINDPDDAKVTRCSAVSLREITSENFRAVLNLKVKPHQQRFIATNDRSIAEAHFSNEAWYRAIYADEMPVGFVMLADESLANIPGPRCCFLWRFMIDARYQRMGFGRKAMDLLVEHVRSHPCATFFNLTYIPGNIDVEKFFLDYGFRKVEPGSITGIIVCGEIELAIDL